MRFAQVALAFSLGVLQVGTACSSGAIGPNSTGSAGTTGGSGTAGATGGTGTAGTTSTTGTAGAGATGSAGASGGGTSGGVPSGGGTVSGCRIFPTDNPWNQDVSGTALHPMNATYMANMNPTRTLHPDWGAGTDGYGIPYSSGTGATPQPMTWTASWGSTESDKVPCPTGTNQFCYPIPLNAQIEGGTGASADSDRHVLYIDTAGGPDNCTLYELYQVQNPTGGMGFTAANGAIFHLGSNTLRPDGLDVGRRGGASNPARAGAPRGGDVRRDQARAPVHHEQAPPTAYIHPATHAAGQFEHRAAADGPAHAAEGVATASATSPARRW